MRDIQSLISLAESATPGPWRSEIADEHCPLPLVVAHETDVVIADFTDMCNDVNDAAYIAALSPSVALSLLREMESCRAALRLIAHMPMKGDGYMQGRTYAATLAQEALNASTTKTEAEGK